jgi:hypothetical protein
LTHRLCFEKDFRAVQIVPSKSEVEPLIQVADLLTAMAAFSRTHIETYRRWKERESGRENLLEKEEQPLTVGEREKCAVLSGFRDRASPHPHIAVQPKQTHRGRRKFVASFSVPALESWLLKANTAMSFVMLFRLRAPAYTI